LKKNHVANKLWILEFAEFSVHQATSTLTIECHVDHDAMTRTRKPAHYHRDAMVAWL
jgi:hypothetical protein